MSLLPGNGRVVPLRSLAKTIRSKNAGCHYYTMDIIFAEHETYRRVMATGVITRELISLLYGIPQTRIVELAPYEHGNAVKITIRRAVTSGDVGDTDVYGCQQYIPLLDIPVPWEGDLPQAPSPSWH